MTDRNFDARSSAAVIVSNSQFFSTSSIRFHTSAADSPSSRLRYVYNLCNGSELGSLSLTVLVISVIAFCSIAHRNMSFISVSNWSRYCGSISLLFVILMRTVHVPVWLSVVRVDLRIGPALVYPFPRMDLRSTVRIFLFVAGIHRCVVGQFVVSSRPVLCLVWFVGSLFYYPSFVP